LDTGDHALVASGALVIENLDSHKGRARGCSSIAAKPRFAVARDRPRHMRSVPVVVKRHQWRRATRWTRLVEAIRERDHLAVVQLGVTLVDSAVDHRDDDVASPVGRRITDVAVQLGIVRSCLGDPERQLRRVVISVNDPVQLNLRHERRAGELANLVRGDGRGKAVDDWKPTCESHSADGGAEGVEAGLCAPLFQLDEDAQLCVGARGLDSGLEVVEDPVAVEVGDRDDRGGPCTHRRRRGRDAGKGEHGHRAERADGKARPRVTSVTPLANHFNAGACRG
jgi:hypothetical protein